MPRDRSLFTSRFVLRLAGLFASAMADCSNESTLTLTDTTEVSSLASCATYFGNIHLTNFTGTVDLTGMETIVGEIYYQNEEDIGITIESSSLKNLTGGLDVIYRSTVSQPEADLYLSLLALESTSSFSVGPGWRALSLETNPNLNLSGDLDISGSQGDQPIQVINLSFNISTVDSFQVKFAAFSESGEPLLSSSVKRVKSYLYITSNDDMKTLLLNDLDFVSYTAEISSNKDLDYISVSAVDVGRLIIEENGRSTSVSLPKLEKLGGRVNPVNPLNPWGNNIGQPMHDGDAGGLFRNLLNISVPVLREAHENEDARQYDSDLSFTSNVFSELSLPRFEIANCTFNITDNVALKDLWIPRLSYAKELEVHDNPQLLNFTANLLKKAERINMTGSFTNVEFFSLKNVTGDFHLAGDETMDCSWLDEHLDGIVKGTYQCVGNHTKPGVERKPSTPTDEAQLEAWESGNSRWRGDDAKNESSEDEDVGGGLSTGAKAGIGVGVPAAVLAAAALGRWLFIRRRKKPQDTATTAPENSAELHGESGTSRAPDHDKDELDNNMPRVEVPSETTRSELPVGLKPEAVELSG